MILNSSITWPSRLALACLPTPFHLLERLTSSLKGPRVWIKRDDLTGSLLSGNKVRKLEYTIAHAIDTGHDLLITCGGLQSNHCRATAFAGAQLGVPVHLVLRGETDVWDGNFLLDHLAGAKVSTHDPSLYQASLPHLLAHYEQLYKEQGYSPYIIPTGASDGVGVWGYFSATRELKSDFEYHKIQPEIIVCATGSGGTQAGLTLGVDYFGLDSQVVGMAVCDNREYFQAKVAADVDDFWKNYSHHFSGDYAPNLLVESNDQYIGDGYAKASKDVFETIHELARTEGILLDPVYTGKAFHGLVTDIKQGCYDGIKDIVFVHTGGGFGIFPYRDSLKSSVKY